MMEQSISNRWVYTGWGILITFALAVLVISGSDGSTAGAKAPGAEATWIIQWKSEPPQQFFAESDVKSYYRESLVTVARPSAGLDEREWRERWSRDGKVESFEPNQRVKAARTPNDPLLTNQRYLTQIRAESAWDVASEHDIVIAVVDTGVDRTHQDLEGRLLQGINLVEPGTPPDDDNGHGTNVAGVIAALGDNDKGTAGLLWNARIMPVKALEADGNGDEDKLGEGIRYAVQNGAKIVVLSLGLNKYSSYMEKIVSEAEEQGVLLVAASGNEGNAVKYPAAYDTVLAVGGVGADNKPERMSNSGPELDLMAPWVVFTTMRGGGYGYQDGTSMAAPQAAGVAALAWKTNPGLTPAGLRNLLRQTAQDLGTPGWDRQTGYGLLRADRAVREKPKQDFYEPNDRQAIARPISSNKSVTAYLAPGEEDWFVWEAPFDGTASYRVTGTDYAVSLTHVSESDRQESDLTASAGQPGGAAIGVEKGRHYVRISGTGGGKGTPYELEVDYSIYRDDFEDNDRQYKAYRLPARSQLITGTFDHYQDQDWFTVTVDQSGTLKLKVSADTARIDPVLSLFRRGEREFAVDHNGDGQPESYEIEVKPGQYFIKIANLASYAYPVTGEYTLDVQLATSYDDPYEPNDKSYQATVLSFGENYFGVLDPSADVDWYRIRLDGESLIHVELGLVPEPQGVQVQLYDAGLRGRSLPMDIQSTNLRAGEARLPTGVYYLKVSSGSGLRQQLYGLRVHTKRMVEGFTDLYGHWAEPEITRMIRNGFVKGYGGYDVYPERAITRAEAAVILDRILDLPSAAPPGFEDISAEHWAYAAIARLTKAGIVKGYSGSEFAPDRSISRMEMMTMLANATGKKGITGGAGPFYDVASGYWGADILRQLKAEGWAAGYEDGTFRPERLASRAEFMYITVRMLGL